MSPKARLRRHERGCLFGEGGQALIEFALILPVLLLLIFGVVDFGKALGYKNDETHLANQAARYAAVNSCTPCGLQTINDWLPGQAATTELRTNLVGNVTFAFADAAGKFPGETGYAVPAATLKNHCAGSALKVKLTYTYHFLGLSMAALTLASSATMRLEADWGDAAGFRAGTDKYRVTPTSSASPDTCA